MGPVGPAGGQPQTSGPQDTGPTQGTEGTQGTQGTQGSEGPQSTGPQGQIDGQVDAGEAGEIWGEELATAEDLGNLTMDNPEQAQLMNQIKLVVAQQRMAQGDVDRSFSDTIEHHHTETGEQHTESDNFSREMGARSSFRDTVRSALETGDRRAIQSAFEQRFGKGALSQGQDQAKTDQAKQQAANQAHPGTQTQPQAGTAGAQPQTGMPQQTQTPARPVLNLSQLTPGQRTMVERFMALRQEARQLRQQAEGMPDGPEKQALLNQAEAKAEEGNGLQAQLAAEGVQLDENTEIREEGEEGAEGTGEGSGDNEAVGGLSRDETVANVGSQGQGESGTGGDGAGSRGETETRLSLSEVASRLYVNLGTGEDKDIEGARASACLRTMHNGAVDCATARAVRMRYGYEEGEGEGRRGRGGGQNPLDASPVAEAPGWSVDTIDGGLGGRTVIRGPDGRIYDRNEVAAARDIRLGKRNSDEGTPRMAALMNLPGGQLDNLLFGATTMDVGREIGSRSTLGHGARFDTLTARCLAISARSDDARYASQNAGHYERAWFA